MRTISVHNLSKSFDGQKVLNNISIEIPKGSFFALMGQSGQGKSVFLQHIAGLLKPDKGSVVIDGVDISKMPEDELLEFRKKSGYLFQEGALFDFMSVFDNVALPLREHTDKKPDEISPMVEAALKEVELEGISPKMPRQLSVGMKKRVALARAIILKPELLLCDEPTAGLDPATGGAISELIYKLCREINTTAIVVTHDAANFFNISTLIGVIHAGEIIALGKKEQICQSKDPVVNRLMQFCKDQGGLPHERS